VTNSRRIFASFSSLAGLVVVAVVGAACAPKDAGLRNSALETRDAWARVADSGATTAVYFTLGNGSTESDTLVGVSSTIADHADMHISTQHNRTMHMTPVTSLPVPAEDSVSFRPLGAHVMLTGLLRPLAAGDSITITLRFVSGATLDVQASVRQP
jgi:copper(I)-binding protein